MTADEIERLAREWIATDDPADSLEAADALARALLLVLPVVRAAEAEHDKWARTGASCTCSVCLTIDRMRAEMAKEGSNAQ